MRIEEKSEIHNVTRQISRQSGWATGWGRAPWRITLLVRLYQSCRTLLQFTVHIIHHLFLNTLNSHRPMLTNGLQYASKMRFKGPSRKLSHFRLHARWGESVVFRWRLEVKVNRGFSFNLKSWVGGWWTRDGLHTYHLYFILVKFYECRLSWYVEMPE